MRGLLFDVNLWVALTFGGHRYHATAKNVIERCSGDFPAFFCEATERSWLRLITIPAIQQSCDAEILTNEMALKFRAIWKKDSKICFLHEEPEEIRELWYRFAGIPSPSPKVWMDAYLAAFAILGNFEMVTLDRDFCKYEKQGLQLTILDK